VVRRDRRHHLPGAGQPRPVQHLLRDGSDLRTDPVVRREHLVGRAHPLVDEQPGGAEQWVAGVVGDDLRPGPVGALDVGPGVAHQPDRPQVQERRPAVAADPLGGLRRDVEARGGVGTVGGEVAQARPVGVRRGHPARRRADADPDLVVLAHQQQRHRHVLEGAVQRRVDRAGRGGVVHRGVPEAAHHHRVGRPGPVDPEPRAAAEGERQTDRAGQVRGDRRGLRHHGERDVAEHLVPPAGDRLVGGGDHAQQHVAHRVLPRQLRGALQVEAAGAVVQQRRVGGPQRRGDGGVRLVARRADAVEADAARPQAAGRQVEVAAAGLGREQPEQPVRVHTGRPRPGRPGHQPHHRVPEVLVDRVTVLVRAHRRSGRG
jgi:hypothetical protein